MHANVRACVCVCVCCKTDHRRRGGGGVCVDLLAFCLLRRILVYIMVNTVFLNSAACIDLDCFRQLFYAKYISIPSVDLNGF